MGELLFLLAVSIRSYKHTPSTTSPHKSMTSTQTGSRRHTSTAEVAVHTSQTKHHIPDNVHPLQNIKRNYTKLSTTPLNPNQSVHITNHKIHPKTHTDPMDKLPEAWSPQETMQASITLCEICRIFLPPTQLQKRIQEMCELWTKSFIIIQKLSHTQTTYTR